MDESATKEEKEQLPQSDEDDEFGILYMELEEKGQRLIEIFNRLTEIDADSAPSKASTILSGLGFTNEMLHNPTKSFSGNVFSFFTYYSNIINLFHIIINIKYLSYYLSKIYRWMAYAYSYCTSSIYRS